VCTYKYRNVYIIKSTYKDPIEWKKIKKYCEDDVLITKDLYEYALANKFLKLKDFKGETIKIPIDTSTWGEKNDSTMTFYVGAKLPNKKSLNNFSKKLSNCLKDISEFSKRFNKQLEFDMLDLTMFADIDIYSFSPEQLAAIRDQHFNGSWASFKKSLIVEEKVYEADIVDRCIKFEKLNKKDIGLVGHKLSYILELVQSNDSNSILN
jgi:hypothetical protein